MRPEGEGGYIPPDAKPQMQEAEQEAYDPKFPGSPEARIAYQFLTSREEFDALSERIQNGTATEKDIAGASMLEATRAVQTGEGDYSGGYTSPEGQAHLEQAREAIVVSAQEASAVGRAARELRDNYGVRRQPN